MAYPKNTFYLLSWQEGSELWLATCSLVPSLRCEHETPNGALNGLLRLIDAYLAGIIMH